MPRLNVATLLSQFHPGPGRLLVFVSCGRASWSRRPQIASASFGVADDGVPVGRGSPIFWIVGWRVPEPSGGTGSATRRRRRFTADFRKGGLRSRRCERPDGAGDRRWTPGFIRTRRAPGSGRPSMDRRRSSAAAAEPSRPSEHEATNRNLHAKIGKLAVERLARPCCRGAQGLDAWLRARSSRLARVRRCRILTPTTGCGRLLVQNDALSAAC